MSSAATPDFMELLSFLELSWPRQSDAKRRENPPMHLPQQIQRWVLPVVQRAHVCSSAMRSQWKVPRMHRRVNTAEMAYPSDERGVRWPCRVLLLVRNLTNFHAHDRHRNLPLQDS